MAAAMGWKGRLAVGPADPVTIMLEFMNEGLKCNQVLTDGGGLRGTIAMPDARVRETQRNVGGSIEMEPCPVELDWIIQMLTGATKVNDATAMNPTYPIPSFFAQVDRDAKVFKYSGLKINKATFSSNTNSPLKCSLDLMGVDETVANAGTFPALTPTEDVPYIMSDLVLSIGGTSYSANNLTLTYDNKLAPYYTNSVTPIRINQTGLDVTWACELPFGDANALYGASAAAGVVCIATFTNGTKSVKFQSNVVRAPKETPTVGSNRDEIPITWTGTARITAAFPNIISITNDST